MEYGGRAECDRRGGCGGSEKCNGGEEYGGGKDDAWSSSTGGGSVRWWVFGGYSLYWVWVGGHFKTQLGRLLVF